MPINLILRQALGFGLPLMILGFFYQVPGVILWWVINGIVVLITPNQQTLFDLIFGLVPVNEPDQEIRFETKVEPNALVKRRVGCDSNRFTYSFKLQ